jgi:hypothetical protein
MASESKPALAGNEDKRTRETGTDRNQAVKRALQCLAVLRCIAKATNQSGEEDMTATKQQQTTSATKDREDWLTKAARMLRLMLLEDSDVSTKAKIRVSCGFPKGSRRLASMTTPRGLSGDQTNEIFISPEIDQPVELLERLAIELVNAEFDATGFAKGSPAHYALQRIGVASLKDHRFVGSTAPLFTKMATALGEYPHVAMNRHELKKDGTRQIKVECTECRAIWRASRQWVDRMSQCPCCGSTAITKH